MSGELNSLISVKGVTYAPGGVAVLSDVSLFANETRIGILGRNGSGKTSLARVMAGLVAPDQGQVSIGGVNVVKDRKGVLGVVGILFQNPDHQIIFPTVEEEIEFGLTQMGQSREQAAAGVSAVLARFDKAHWAKAAVHQLSQGQRQLVCLMSILAMQPRVIILDEPFAGLDIPTTMQLRRMLLGLDVAVVLITHDPEILAHFDRVIWVDQGRIVLDGQPATVVPAFEAKMHEVGGGDDLSDLTS